MLVDRCPCEGSRGVSRDGGCFGRFFNQFFNNVITQFEIALFCLVCRFGVVENLINQSRVIYDTLYI